MKELIKTDNYHGITKAIALATFDIIDGKLFWKDGRQAVKVGSEAGGITAKGYRRIMVDKIECLTHRLLFLVYHGWIPKNAYQWHIDHEDGDKLNNLEYNLRCCTVNQNASNRKSMAGASSKYLGVSSTNSKRSPWQALIRSNKKQKHIGVYATEELAAKAYDKAALHHHGEYANLNFK